MPHFRNRFASPMIQKSLTHSGVVGLFGQRQVGKTTLLVVFSKEFITFDNPKELAFAMEDAETFITNKKAPFGIDEAQFCPPLFPALKEYVRLHKSPGQFLLSGSVRFTSRKAIRESLTGRIVGVEILPFTIAEAHGRKMPQILNKLCRGTEKSIIETIGKNKTSKKDFEVYLETGGLPGICYFRDAQVRSQRFEFHVDTILSRDYQLVHETTLSKKSLRDLLMYLAVHQGEPIELKDACEFAQISHVTIKKVLNAFEALFLIREVSAHQYSGESKRMYFFEDQGMAGFLAKKYLRPDHLQITCGLYANLRQELFYTMGDLKDITSYRTKNGVNVPLVFGVNREFVGIIPSAEKTPSTKAYSAAESFLKAVPNSIAVIACADPEVRFLKRNLIQLPYWKLC